MSAVLRVESGPCWHPPTTQLAPLRAPAQQRKRLLIKVRESDQESTSYGKAGVAFDFKVHVALVSLSSPSRLHSDMCVKICADTTRDSRDSSPGLLRLRFPSLRSSPALRAPIESSTESIPRSYRDRTEIVPRTCRDRRHRLSPAGVQRAEIVPRSYREHAEIAVTG